MVCVNIARHPVLAVRPSLPLAFAFLVFVLVAGIGNASAEEDEWFAWYSHSTSDRDDDGEKDSITFYFAPRTDEDEQEVRIVFQVDDGDGSHASFTEYYDLDGDDNSSFYFETWNADEEDTYDFYVRMYDEDDNLEDQFNATDVSLSEYTGGDDEDESDQWFHQWDYYTYDRNNDDEDDSIRFEYNIRSEDAVVVNVVTVIFKDGDYHDFESAHFTLDGGNVSNWNYLSWTSKHNGTFQFNTYLYDDDGNLEDYFVLSNIGLKKYTGQLKQ